MGWCEVSHLSHLLMNFKTQPSRRVQRARPNATLRTRTLKEALGGEHNGTALPEGPPNLHLWRQRPRKCSLGSQNGQKGTHEDGPGSKPL